MTGFKSVIARYAKYPLLWLISSKVQYLHHGSRGFVQENSLWRFRPLANQTLPVVILAREHYQEFVRSYPVTQISELKAVLAQEYAEKSMVFHYVAPVDNNQRTVCTFVIANGVEEQLAKSWLILPETLLLWLSEDFKNRILSVQGACPYFFYGGDKVPVSQRKGLLCQTDDAFKLVQGIPVHTDAVPLSDMQLSEVLVKALLASWTDKSIGNFVRLPTGGHSSKTLKQAVSAVSITALLYMAASSFYLTQAIDNTEVKLQALGTDIGDLLSAQQQYEQIVTDYQLYFEQRNTKSYFAHIWLVLSEAQAVESDLELSNLALEGNEIVLRGRTARATELLAKLKASPHVATARFSAPVLRENDKESFVIAVKLHNTKVSQEQADEQE